jgi:hypothetical protein
MVWVECNLAVGIIYYLVDQMVHGFEAVQEVWLRGRTRRKREWRITGRQTMILKIADAVMGLKSDSVAWGYSWTA